MACAGRFVLSRIARHFVTSLSSLWDAVDVLHCVSPAQHTIVVPHVAQLSCTVCPGCPAAPAVVRAFALLSCMRPGLLTTHDTWAIQRRLLLSVRALACTAHACCGYVYLHNTCQCGRYQQRPYRGLLGCFFAARRKAHSVHVLPQQCLQKLSVFRPCLRV